MTRIIRMLMAAAAAGAFVILGLLSAGAASASTSGPNYEVDDGVSRTLTTGPSNLSAPVQSASYADAGVVASLGLADNFASVDTATGVPFTGSANLQENIWIGDGTEANTPGTHLLSAGVNFSYGFSNGYGTFWMTSGPFAGHSLDAGQIATDFKGSAMSRRSKLSFQAPSLNDAARQPRLPYKPPASWWIQGPSGAFRTIGMPQLRQTPRSVRSTILRTVDGGQCSATRRQADRGQGEDQGWGAQGLAR